MSAYLPIFNVSPAQTIYLDIAAAVIVAISAAIIPTCRSVNIRIADGLRKIT